MGELIFSFCICHRHTYLKFAIFCLPQEGSLRCDVNISVREKNQLGFGVKVEIKNMNSFNAMQRAIEFEFQRQVDLHLQGLQADIVQETRLWDEGEQVTKSMRRKEGLADYRYFPEPDLPSLIITDDELGSLSRSMPELPSQKRERYQSLGLSLSDALVLSDEVETSTFYDNVLKCGAPAKPAANWVMGDITAFCKEHRTTMTNMQMSEVTLTEMILLIEEGVISGKIAKDLLPDLLAGKGEGVGLKALVEERGLVQISDPGALSEIVDRVLQANPKQLEQYRAGKTKLQGFFVGQVMKESKGRANPAELNRILMERLDGVPQ